MKNSKSSYSVDRLASHGGWIPVATQMTAQEAETVRSYWVDKRGLVARIRKVS